VARVSIAIPAYNVEAFVGLSIESLLGQSYGDIEVVISDNASTDGTEEICRSYAAKDARVRYVRRQTNIGGPGNFRYVFSLCSGELHKWSTADDYWHKDFVAKAVGVLDSNPDVVLCYPKTRMVDVTGAPIEDYDDNLHLLDESPTKRFADVIDRLSLCHAHLGLIRRSALARTRLIAPHKWSDMDFIAEMALYGKFWVLPEVMFFRRWHPESSSWARTSEDHQRKYYDPAQKFNYHKMLFLKKYWHLTTSVLRAPIGTTEKGRGTLVVGQRAYWDWTRRNRVDAGARRT
jgi:glycosyltransferase involved in cell wall biosynthesis